jgi:LPS export ABC transporter protein LptC
MMVRIPVFVLVLLGLTIPVSGIQEHAFSQESGQQINDFSLAGYGEKGKKDWDISGTTADILNDVVKLHDVIGNLYDKEEDIHLTAEKGDFNKTSGSVHLQDNVVITTSTGARLTTESLDWDRKNQLVSTRDPVNIQKDNLLAAATGANGEPNLKKVALEKDVRVDILPVPANESGELDGKETDGNEKIVITCDGPMEIDYAKNVATFKNNVKVEREDSTIYSDLMDVYFIAGSVAGAEMPEGSPAMAGNKIDRIVARQNVKIVRGPNISYSDEAIYHAADKKITLNGRPKLVIYSGEGSNDAPFGN